MGYYDLGREARVSLTTLKKALKQTQAPDDADTKSKLEAAITKWEARLAELGIRVASALIEMEDLEGATRFLATLNIPDDEEGAKDLAIRKTLLWLCLGDVEAARSCITSMSASSSPSQDGQIILALAYMADADFESAVEAWEDMLKTSTSNENTPLLLQNLAISLLYLGKMDAARTILEELIDAKYSFHALTFNLSTVFELCTERSRALKIGLAERVALMVGGGEGDEDGKGKEGDDGRGKRGWEKVNGDFKL